MNARTIHGSECSGCAPDMALRCAALALFPLTFTTGYAESIDREFLEAAAAGDKHSAVRLLDDGADPEFRRIGTTVHNPETTALREAMLGGNRDIVGLLLDRISDDRILRSGIGALPWPEKEEETGVGDFFIRKLLERGRHDFLASVVSSLRTDSQLRQVFEAGAVNNPAGIKMAMLRSSWPMVELAAESMDDFSALESEQSRPGDSFPEALVARIQRRPHEEERAAAMWQSLLDRGMDGAGFGGNLERAAAIASDSGLRVLAEALIPGAVDEAASQVTDEMRMASAFYWEDHEELERYREMGVVLRGTASIGAGSGILDGLVLRLIREGKHERLLDSGIDLDDWEENIQNPIRAATSVEQLRWLLDQGGAADRDPMLVAWWAVHSSMEKVKMAELAIEHGAEIHTLAGVSGWTPLHTVVMSPHGEARVEFAEMLLRHGADPELPDKSGKSARQYAEENFQIDLLKLLDPDRKSDFWRNYGAADEMDHIGAWSNEKGEFKSLAVLLMPSGKAVLSGSVFSNAAFWRLDDGRILIDVVEGRIPGEIRIGLTMTLEKIDGEKDQYRLSAEDFEETFKKVHGGEEFLEMLAEDQNKARQQPETFGRRRLDPDEAREDGLRIMGGERTPTQSVNLRDWPDEELPGHFRDPELKWLEIVRGGLKRLPVDFAERFPNLEALTIQDVGLESIDIGLERLGRLERLDLTGLQLEYLPDIRMARLKRLVLEDNWLHKIPGGWFASEHLSSVNLSNNRLSEVPSGIGENVESLDLSANQLRRIDFSRWPNLVQFTGRENRIDHLDESVSRLEFLRRLDLSGNRIASLPGSMRGLKSLDVIDLSHNDLTEIPLFLNEIEGLRVVLLPGNLIPESIIGEVADGQGTSGIFRFRYN